MPVSNVNGDVGIRSYEEYQEQSRKPNTELGRNEFLNLLAAQLQFQDPLEPMKDSDFVAQLAQFSSLQQMEALNASMEMMQFYNFVGKFVYAEVRMDDGNLGAVSGVVESVYNQDGRTMLVVNGMAIDSKEVLQVFDKDSVFGDNPLLGSANLIGLEVKANYLNENNEKEVFTGTVTRIHIKNGEMVADIQDSDGQIKTIAINNIIDIAQENAPPTPEIPDTEDQNVLPENDIKHV